MKKEILEEIKDMKYLLNYNRGRILSEQPEVNVPDLDEEYEDMEGDEELYPSFDEKGDFLGMEKPMGDMELDYTLELDEEMDFDFDEMDEQREVETPVRPGIKTPTKPSKPSTPYRPKPGPKKAPKAEKKNIPDWLTFDELGINFE